MAEESTNFIRLLAESRNFYLSIVAVFKEKQRGGEGRQP